MGGLRKDAILLPFFRLCDLSGKHQFCLGVSCFSFFSLRKIKVFFHLIRNFDG